jgi:hypothetical protein
MSCTSCKSKRLCSVNGKCDDRCTVEVGGADCDDYVPSDLGIGGGDYLRFTYCLDCGKIQGSFPLEKTELEDNSNEVLDD